MTTTTRIHSSEKSPDGLTEEDRAGRGHLPPRTGILPACRVSRTDMRIVNSDRPLRNGTRPWPGCWHGCRDTVPGVASAWQQRSQRHT